MPLKFGIVGAWSSIAKLGTRFADFNIALQDLFNGQVADGGSLRFWIDLWIGASPLRLAFPDLFKLDRNKDCFIKDRLSWQNDSQSWTWNWISQPSSLAELSQLHRLTVYLQHTRLSEEPDAWTWDLETSGSFTVSSISRHIQDAFFGPAHWKFPWNKFAPLNSNVLCWRIEQDCIPTRDLLEKRGVPIPSRTCPLCRNFIETSDHLFLHCEFARLLWTLVTAWCKAPSSPPRQFAQFVPLPQRSID